MLVRIHRGATSDITGTGTFDAWCMMIDDDDDDDDDDDNDNDDDGGNDDDDFCGL